MRALVWFLSGFTATLCLRWMLGPDVADWQVVTMGTAIGVTLIVMVEYLRREDQ